MADALSTTIVLCGEAGRARTAYRCRAYPTPERAAVLNRTFGGIRVAWNRTLAARHARWHTERKSISCAETDRPLTVNVSLRLASSAWTRVNISMSTSGS
ncbi:helix-turn-helix domain-containing protein [Micromonospora sp. NPDC023814]|uniref:helix-turn-helix domain-containing protein n=1 Tax=Micromonospora sp. NPDC023814 TaxID=3154596 RepID=UPI00340EA54B